MSFNVINSELDSLLNQLPYFVYKYIRRRKDRTSYNTRVAYCRDIKLFLEYLLANNPYFKKYKNISDIEVEALNVLTKDNIEDFLEDIEEYEKVVKSKTGTTYKMTFTNNNKGKMRKLATLKSFFHYLYRNKLIKEDITVDIEFPVIKDKVVLALEPHQSAKLLDAVENYNLFNSSRDEKLYKRNKKRDLAIIGLLLLTGIRVSECINLNLSNMFLDDYYIIVKRKGGREDQIFLNDEVVGFLNDYIRQRDKFKDKIKAGHEDALFLSMHYKRITKKQINNIISKYANFANLPDVTCHILRKTAGTQAYIESGGDLKFTQNLLGHSDPKTTEKHYVATIKEREREFMRKRKIR